MGTLGLEMGEPAASSISHEACPGASDRGFRG